ncbi:uncharacterized protein ISCGN_011075 [Ixodes scapularis]
MGRSVLGRSVLGRSVLGRSVLGRSVLGRSVLGRSVLGRSVLGRSVLGRSVLGRSVLGRSVLGRSVLGRGARPLGARPLGARPLGARPLGAPRDNACKILLRCSATPHYPELNPKLQIYQDASKGFPLAQTWYMLYRNYEKDPAFGTSKCLRHSHLKSEKDGQYQTLAQYGENQSAKARTTLESTEGYTAKNQINIHPEGREPQFGVDRLQHRSSAIVLSAFKEMVAAVGLLAASLAVGISVPPHVVPAHRDHSTILLRCSATPHYPELNPKLQIYQDASKGFPLAQTWYMLYRNYEKDPAFGTSKCLRHSHLKSEKDGQYQTLAQYGENQSAKARTTLESTEGYTAKNQINIHPEGRNITLSYYISFLDVKKCAVSRNIYVNEDACSVVVPEDQLGKSATCCDFIYDLLCGTKKYQISDTSCKNQH